MSFRTIWLCLALAGAAWAHKMCDICVPIEDLLVPGYGVSVSMDGLSSAVAYHNGTFSTLSVATASEQYRTLMSNALAQRQTGQQRSAMIRCHARPRWRARPWDKDILKLVRSYAHGLSQKVLQIGHDSQEVRPPLDPVTQMLQAEFLALEPFASMNAEQRSRIVLAIQTPAWLMSSPYACNLLEAADAIFDQAIGLESPSSAAYTALGYELCRVDHDAYDCTGPGRLDTLEYDGKFAVASMTKTPTGAVDRFRTQYSISTSSDPLELSEWINSFLDRTTPDMITLAGPHTDKPTFQEAVALSKAAGRLIVHDSVDAQAILVVGAAQVAKDALENHDSDCDEFDYCLDVRAEADKVAGEYVYTRPTTWPASNYRHWKRWQESSITEEHFTTPLILPNLPELVNNGY